MHFFCSHAACILLTINRHATFPARANIESSFKLGKISVSQKKLMKNKFLKIHFIIKIKYYNGCFIPITTLLFLLFVFFTMEPEKPKPEPKEAWDNLFAKSRKRNSEDNFIKKDQNLTMNKESSFVCLKCGTILTRGRESAKKRHFLQKHKDLDVNLALKFIVPENNAEARKFMKIRSSSPSIISSSSSTHSTISGSSSTIVSSDIVDTPAATPRSIQQTIDCFKKRNNDENYDTADTQLETIQKDVNQIKVNSFIDFLIFFCIKSCRV